MPKLPAIQFYPADWRKDPAIQSLSYHDRGVWFEILCLMHESEQRGKLLLNGQKMPEDALARLLGLDKQNLTKTLNTLLAYGVASIDDETGAFMNRRMVRDEEIRKIRQTVGKKGGNPFLLNQSSNQNVQPSLTKNQPLHSSSSTANISTHTEHAHAHETVQTDTQPQTGQMLKLARTARDALSGVEVTDSTDNSPPYSGIPDPFESESVKLYQEKLFCRLDIHQAGLIAAEVTDLEVWKETIKTSLGNGFKEQKAVQHCGSALKFYHREVKRRSGVTENGNNRGNQISDKHKRYDQPKQKLEFTTGETFGNC